MGDFYIRITKSGLRDEYNVAHDGIESCGQSATQTVESVVEMLGISGSSVGKAVRRAAAEERYLQARKAREQAEERERVLEDRLASIGNVDG